MAGFSGFLRRTEVSSLRAKQKQNKARHLGLLLSSDERLQEGGRAWQGKTQAAHARQRLIVNCHRLTNVLHVSKNILSLIY